MPSICRDYRRFTKITVELPGLLLVPVIAAGFNFQLHHFLGLSSPDKFTVRLALFFVTVPILTGLCLYPTSVRLINAAF